MKFNKIFLAVLPVAALMFALSATAQPYYTNSAVASGGYQPGDSFTTPLQPSAILARQYAGGTLAGSITPGLIPSAGFYTNTFTTNIYTVAPFVLATSSVTNNAPAITSVTTTGFVIQVLNTNCTVYWEATGH